MPTTMPTAFFFPVSQQMSTDRAVDLVKRALPACDHLRRKPWRGSLNLTAGHCYVACEAVKHMSMDKLTPCWVKHQGTTHWFLRTAWGEIIDPTASQFSKPPNYDHGRGCGFLTKQPSRRAQAMIELAKQQQPPAFPQYTVTFTATTTFPSTSWNNYAAIRGTY